MADEGKRVTIDDYGIVPLIRLVATFDLYAPRGAELAIWQGRASAADGQFVVVVEVDGERVACDPDLVMAWATDGRVTLLNLLGIDDPHAVPDGHPCDGLLAVLSTLIACAERCGARPASTTTTIN